MGLEKGCPCYKFYEDDLEFKKVMQLNASAGLVIYRHTTPVNSDASVSQPEKAFNTKDNVFIIHNTKNRNVSTSNYMPEFEQAISCPRCRYIVKHTKELLLNVPFIRKKDVIGICDHCRFKKRINDRCNKCQLVVEAFLKKQEQKQEERSDSDKQEKVLTAKIKHILKDAPKAVYRKSKSQLRSDTSLRNASFRYKTSPTSHVPHVKDMFEIKKKTEKNKQHLKKAYLRQIETPKLYKYKSDSEITLIDHAKRHREHKKPKKNILFNSAENIAFPESSNESVELIGLENEHQHRLDRLRQKLKPKIELDLERLPSTELEEYLQKDYSFRHTDYGSQKWPSVKSDMQEKEKIKKDKHSYDYIHEAKYDQEVSKSSQKEEIFLKGIQKPSRSAHNIRRYSSQETLPRSASATSEAKSQKDFSYFFIKDVVKKPPRKRISSSELIKDTQDMYHARAEEERLKKEQELKENLEAEEKKRLAKIERKRRREEERRLEELKKKKAEEELKKQRAEEELMKKRAEEELMKKKTEEEPKKQRAEEELMKKRAEEELMKKKTEEEPKKQRAEEELMKKMTEEEPKKQRAEEELMKKRAKEELTKKKTEEEPKKQRAEEELMKKRAEEELMKKKTEEEPKKQRAEEELMKKRAKEELMKKKTEEEPKKQRAEEELMKKRAKEELMKKKTEEEPKKQRAEEELMKKRAKEELMKKKTEEEPKKQRAEEELMKKRAEEELKRKRAGEEQELNKKKISKQDTESQKKSVKSSKEPSKKSKNSKLKDSKIDKSLKSERDSLKLIKEQEKQDEEELMRLEKERKLKAKAEKEEQMRKAKEEKQKEKEEKEKQAAQLRMEKEQKQREKKDRLKAKTERQKEKEEMRRPKPETENVSKDIEEDSKKEQLEQQLADQQKEKESKKRKKQEDEAKKLEAQLKLKSLREAKAEIEPEKPQSKKIPEETKMKELNINQVKVRKNSTDDLILQLVKLKQRRNILNERSTRLSQIDIPNKTLRDHIGHKNIKTDSCIICLDSDLELDIENIRMIETKPKEINDIIIGQKIFKYTPPLVTKKEDKGIKPLFFESTHTEGENNIAKTQELKKNIEKPVKKKKNIVKPIKEKEKKPPVLSAKYVEQEVPKGIIRYALSDRTFIEKGWTMLPTEKVVRKMNVYRMRPAHPEFDWFEHNKSKKLICYDTGEKLAEFNDSGKGRWFYRNGKVALDYYDAEEINAQQRIVIFSSGEPDERGCSRPFAILATFDYLGNGIVFDHSGKIRLKYNQTEGVVLDRSIGPVSHWKWHTLNDPPVLQQVMIDTQMAHKDPEILKLGGSHDNKPRPDNEEMLAIEFDNFIKEKSKKLSQKFKPFQIKMKALKINEYFSLKVLDQATIYLIYRNGSTNLKLNIGMILDHQEIVDTDTAEVGEVSNSLQRFPARTDSLAGLQKSVAHAQRVERARVERTQRLRPTQPSASADQLVAGLSRPRPAPPGQGSCQCRKPPTFNLYYDTRLI